MAVVVAVMMIAVLAAAMMVVVAAVLLLMGVAGQTMLPADPVFACRGVRPAQLKSIFERPPSAAAEGEENQDPQGRVGQHDAACEGGKGLGLTEEDIGVLGEQQAPARQIISSGMIWQVTYDSGCNNSY
jgi:hypothetical protein